MGNLSSNLITLIKQIVAWLVAGNFEAVEQRSNGVRLSAALLTEAIKDYGRTLVMPPDETFVGIDAIAVANAPRPTWSIRIDLWTQEEGRSDLTLECTVIENSGDNLSIEIDNLHVL